MMRPPELAPFIHRIHELRRELSLVDPGLLASRTGAAFSPADERSGVLHLPLWGKAQLVSFPGLIASDSRTGQEASPAIQALLLYHFKIADGAPIARRWVAFSELPDGRFYNAAFQGYTGRELQRTFSGKLSAFQSAAQAAGGAAPADSGLPGDGAYQFLALPRLPLLVAWWEGDEDFSSSFHILFDASAPHYLPTDVCAILGSMLTRRILNKHI